MKKSVVSSFAILILVVASAAVSVHAQSAGEIRVNIPFEFTAGDKALPAGQYSVRRVFERSDSPLYVQNRKSSETATIMTQVGPTSSSPAGVRLVFNRYGEEYFLSQVWTDEGRIGREVSKSKRERSLEKELAQHASKSERVVVVAAALE